MLAWRRLVGRRREVRTALRALRADDAFTREHGEVGGVALTGIGGVGKGTIAGRVIARLGDGATPKYEHLYLHEIDDGPALAEHVAGYERIYNQERPHEAIAWARPRDRYTEAPR